MTVDKFLSGDMTKYRSLPFWSWNDRLEPESLRTQIREMKAAGIGGFFMHARGGLHTEYLSKEWFDAVRGSIAAAQKHGMQPWAYDENGWPSGFADGFVPKMGLEYQQKYLRLTEIAAAVQRHRSTNCWGLRSMSGNHELCTCTRMRCPARNVWAMSVVRKGTVSGLPGTKAFGRVNPSR